MGLTETPTATARYYSDAACTASVTSTTIPAGQSSASFYLKPLTGGTASQTASAPFGSASRSLVIVPAVRRSASGTCNFAGPTLLPDGGSMSDFTESCGISPNHQSLSRTALFFQATTSSSSAGTAMIRCTLSSTSSIFCERDDANSSAIIHWQTIELPIGFRVERRTANCQSPSPWTTTLPAAVNPASSFLLTSYSLGSGDIDDDDVNAVRLISPTVVEIDHGISTTLCAGGTIDIQALEVAGTTVTRGVEDGGLAVGATSLTISGLPPVSANTAVLSSHTVPNTNLGICNVLVRSEMPTQSSLQFSRGSGFDGGCVVEPVFRIAWERVDFGNRARVQTRTVSLGPGVFTEPVTILPVDPTRSVVFASSGVAAGQSAGESSHSSTNNKSLSEGNARFELTTSTNVNVIRQRSLGTGTFTFFVVEFDP